MVKIALIGCTGSIGRQTIEIIRKYPDRFSLSSLCCEGDAEGLFSLVNEFHPPLCALASGKKLELPAGTKQLFGEEIEEGIFEGCDVAMIAAGGFAGLSYTLRAVRLHKRVALANKESLVCGGELVMAELARTGGEIVPVDSEHSALFQALSFRRDTPFHRLVLTASGGPFLHLEKKELEKVTAKDALRHPTWKMGAKITIDCATLLNKGYEVVEAKWLYDTSFDKIEAVVHPQSIVHSLVQFEDGSSIAQLGYPDMKVPIQLALTYPERLPCTEQLDLSKVGRLEFLTLPREKFPCFDLAVEAGKAGGTAACVLNGAAEIAVHAFLADGISFPRIAQIIGDVLAKIPAIPADCYEAIAEVDRRARRAATELIYGK